MVRHEDGLVVLVVAEKDFELSQSADYFQVVAIHQDDLAEWIDVGKNRSRTPLPITATSRRCRSSVSVKKRPSPSVALMQPQVVRGHADEERVEHLLALVARGHGRQSEITHLAEQFHGNGGGGGHQFLDGHGVFVAERFAQALFAGERVRRAQLQLVNP